MSFLNYGLTSKSATVTSGDLPYTLANFPNDKFTIEAIEDCTVTAKSAGNKHSKTITLLAGETKPHLFSEITAINATVYINWE